jgi:hypothetical protein
MHGASGTHVDPQVAVILDKGRELVAPDSAMPMGCDAATALEMKSRHAFLADRSGWEAYGTRGGSRGLAHRAERARRFPPITWVNPPARKNLLCQILLWLQRGARACLRARCCSFAPPSQQESPTSSPAGALSRHAASSVYITRSRSSASSPLLLDSAKPRNQVSASPIVSVLMGGFNGLFSEEE